MAGRYLSRYGRGKRASRSQFSVKKGKEHAYPENRRMVG